MSEDEKNERVWVAPTAEEWQEHLKEIERLKKSSRNKWRLMTVWIVAFSVAVIFGYLQNRDRVDDIQKARIESCQKTYRSFSLVFKGLIPPKAVRTPKMQADIDQFNENIVMLTAGCVNQTKADR